MNVKELREQLELAPDERPVILSRDPEGNGYSELADVDLAGLIERDGYYVGAIHPDDAEEHDVESAVILWP